MTKRVRVRVFIAIAIGVCGSLTSAFARPPADSDELMKWVNQAIDETAQRHMTVGYHRPWQILHGVLALREDLMVWHDGELVSALDWLSNESTYENEYIFQKTADGGRSHPFTVPYAFEGHVNQFLAILSMSKLPGSYEFIVQHGEVVTMDDMVRHAKRNITGEGELTWTLWFFAEYLEPDDEWVNKYGNPWSMEQIVRIEARKQVENAPCGGTHRLFALARARDTYLAKHGRLRGAWIEADQRVKGYIRAAQYYQNRDGTFSSEWFKGRGHSTDLNQRLKTSGHILEFLMIALDDQQLSQPWVRAAVQAVAYDIIRSSKTPTDSGPLYHALDALVLYRDRVAPRPKKEAVEQPVAEEGRAEEPAGVVRMDSLEQPARQRSAPANLFLGEDDGEAAPLPQTADEDKNEKEETAETAKDEKSTDETADEKLRLKPAGRLIGERLQGPALRPVAGAPALKPVSEEESASDETPAAAETDAETPAAEAEDEVKETPQAAETPADEAVE